MPSASLPSLIQLTVRAMEKTSVGIKKGAHAEPAAVILFGLLCQNPKATSVNRELRGKNGHQPKQKCHFMVNLLQETGF
jgi:hypothetical protein